MKTFNSKFRSNLAKVVDNNMLIGMDAKMSMYTYADMIGDLNDFYSNIISIYLVSLGFIDAYRIYSYKAKECLANDEELDMYYQLENIQDYTDLMKDAYTDFSFLRKLIYSSYLFGEMDALGKINLTKSLSDSEKEWLEGIVPMIEQDYEQYDKEVTIEDIVMNLKKKKKYQEQMDGRSNRDKLIISVTGFLRNLVKNDVNNGNNLLLEIAKIDYEACKFMMSKSQDDAFIDHVDLYENYDLDCIISRMLTDQSFLYDAVESVFSVCVEHIHYDNEVKREELQTEEVKEVEKKFVLK